MDFGQVQVLAHGFKSQYKLHGLRGTTRIQSKDLAMPQETKQNKKKWPGEVNVQFNPQISPQSGEGGYDQRVY